MSKAEIAMRASDWCNSALEQYSAGDLYTFVKQMEHAVDLLLGQLKEPAFNSISTSFGGEMSGSVLGHEVKLSYRREWVYSAAIYQLEEKQKTELKNAKLREQIDGIAKREEKPGTITVNLSKGGDK